MSSGAGPRAAAAQCLAAVAQGSTLERAFAEQAAVADCAPRDLPLLRELCYGTLRHWPLLDAILDQLLDRPLRRRDVALKTLLLVGLYQLAYLRTPEHAAVSATVEATGSIGRKSARGLVNAVLRRYLRERDTLHDALAPAAAAAMPAWLWDALGAAWPQQRDAIAAACATRPPLTLRVNRQRGSRADYLAELAAADIDARPGALSSDAVTLATGRDVTAIPGFAGGLVSVQDEAAQLAAPLLAPQGGERILDACAAPGGKALHLLEMAPDSALLACDSSAERLQRVEENAARLALPLAVACADLRSPPPEVREQGPFDAILLDVPCSATGVVRRHPDIKLLRRRDDIAGFAAQQRALLDGCWSLLKPGGRLLYVTCSLLPAENAEVVSGFLAATDDAREQDISVPGAVPCAHGQQLLPAADGPDGLYFALLVRSPARAA